MERHNKRQRQLNALAQARKDAQSRKNEAESGDDEFKVETECFSSKDDAVEIDLEQFYEIIPTFLTSNRPRFYSGDSDRTKRRKKSELSAAARLTGQTLFSAWGIASPKQEPNSVRSYKRTNFSEEEVVEALRMITEMCDSLKNKRKVQRAAFSLDSPYDTIRVLAVRDYIQFLFDGRLKVDSSTSSAKRYIPLVKNRSVEWFARNILQWGDYFIKNKQLPVSSHGKHKKTLSFIDDEDIQLQILAWLRSLKPSKRTAQSLRSFLSAELVPDPISISLSTALRLLDKLCFEVTDTDKKKGSIYVDGHERQDVVEYRTRFCERWFTKYSLRMAYFEGEDMIAVEPELPHGVQKLVPVFHDESTFRANEDQRFCRLEKDEQILKPKSAGRGLMVSEFVCPCHGRMVNPDTGNPSRILLKYGKNYDGYWTGENVSEQLRNTHSTFQRLHPNCLALYIFDNSANHHKIATDALNARKLNLKDGGKNTPLLRDGWYYNDRGEKVVHVMQTEEGIQKGIRTILMERGLWVNGMNKDDALEVLLTQEDFNPDNLNSILDETAKSLGAWLDFVPKFHPEFNFIEMYWGYAKRKVRKECDYEWESLLEHVPVALDSAPLLFMRRAYTKCTRYIDAYRVGLTPLQVEYAVRKYKSHRSIPPEYLKELL